MEQGDPWKFISQVDLIAGTGLLFGYLFFNFDYCSNDFMHYEFSYNFQWICVYIIKLSLFCTSLPAVLYCLLSAIFLFHGVALFVTDNDFPEGFRMEDIKYAGDFTRIWSILMLGYEENSLCYCSNCTCNFYHLKLRWYGR